MILLTEYQRALQTVPMESNILDQLAGSTFRNDLLAQDLNPSWTLPHTSNELDTAIMVPQLCPNRLRCASLTPFVI